MYHHNIKMKYVCISSVNGSSPPAECPLHFSLLGSLNPFTDFTHITLFLFLLLFYIILIYSFYLICVLQKWCIEMKKAASKFQLTESVTRRLFFTLKPLSLSSLLIRLPSCVLISECVDTLSNQQVVLCSLNNSVCAN